MRSLICKTTPNSATTHRRSRIIAMVVVVTALAVTGCTTTTTRASTPHLALPASPENSTGTAVNRTPRSTVATKTTVITPARAQCVISPTAGLAGSSITLACRGFASSEPVALTFLAEVVKTTRATSNGDVMCSLRVPTGFAGSHYPGRQDTFHTTGRQSGKVASVTFTVKG
ncbi:MAG: hypothetical protein ACJ75K_04185 [Actinomycetes bacterium]